MSTFPQSADVVVIGGGFSGLSAALNLQKQGLKAVVLEASDRLGGKSYTKPLESGRGVVEMGCTWINSTTQKRMWSLVQAYNLEAKEQYVSGNELFQDSKGNIHQNAVGEIPTTIDPAELETLERLTKLMHEETEKLNPETPGKPLGGAGALAFEDTSVEDWLKAHGAIGFAYFSIFFVCTGLLGVEPREVGLYFFLELVKSCGGFEAICSDLPGGGQHYKIKTGTTSVVQCMARSLQVNSVFTESPVSRISQYSGHCTVSTVDGRAVTCSKVIITIPTNKYHKIAFEPPLPNDKSEYISQCRDNTYCKIIITYRTPWWRELGYVGKFSSISGPINFSWDICNPDTAQYSIALFSVGDSGTEWAKLNRIQRERALLVHLAAMVEPSKRHLVFDVLEYNEQNWGEEQWIGGACYPALGAGSYQQLLPKLKEPFLNLHFGGTETGSVWRGYMEGAVEAGERCAQEVVSALPTAGSTSAKL